MWPFKKKAAIPNELEDQPFLHFWVTKQGALACDAHLPKTKNKDDEDMLTENVGILLYLIGKGRLLPMAQQAVAEAGKDTNLPATSQAILAVTNKLLAGSAPPKPTGPIIAPQQAFKPKFNQPPQQPPQP